MEKHYREVHLRERRFPCLLCGRRFSQSCNLLRHVRSQHGLHPASAADVPAVMQAAQLQQRQGNNTHNPSAQQGSSQLVIPSQFQWHSSADQHICCFCLCRARGWARCVPSATSRLWSCTATSVRSTSRWKPSRVLCVESHSARRATCSDIWLPFMETQQPRKHGSGLALPKFRWLSARLQ